MLYLASSALDSPVKGWSYYDGWSDDPVGIGHGLNHPTAPAERCEMAGG